jgi:hypothetical protein
VIRHLRALTRPVRALHPDAIAIGVYSQPTDSGYRLRPAAEQGYEGVACVDDAARAVVLYCRIWRERAVPWARAEADRLLRFVVAMQDDDGAFSNFILDWQGSPNRAVGSSLPGGEWWTSRAMHAVACGYGVLRRDEYRDAFVRGLPWLDRPFEQPGALGSALIAGLEFVRLTGDGALLARCHRWAESLADNRQGDALLDGPEGSHLWGHMQESALVRAGRFLRRPEYVAIAHRSAMAVLAPPAETAFTDRASTLPYDVSSVVMGLDAVAHATGDPDAGRAANLGRAWFRGRNSALIPTYDAAAGRVYDGIDDGRVNLNSGAEANIEGAFALFDSLPWDRYGPPCERSTGVPAEVSD